MENESETSKNGVDQIFTGENKKKNKLNFLPFSRFTCFLNWTVPGLWVDFLVLLSYIPYKKSEGVALGLFMFEVFTGLWLSTPTFCIKGYDYVKRFVLVLVLLVMNTGCPKKLLKMGNTTLLISSSNYAKTPYKCVHRRQFVFPVFSAIFLKHPVCKDFPCLTNEGRFPQVGDSIFFCLPRVYLYLWGTAFRALCKHPHSGAFSVSDS